METSVKGITGFKYNNWLVVTLKDCFIWNTYVFKEISKGAELEKHFSKLA